MQQPGSVAIEREAAKLRTLRRLSSSNGPGSLPLDPDLPIPRVPPNGHLWHNDGDASATDLPAKNDDETLAGDPSSMFWLPAHLHPELAPEQFRAFLKEHTSSAPGSNPAPAPLGRSLSRGSGSLTRQKSMLSRQYRPSANDGVEHESVPTPLSRRTTRGGSSYQDGPSISPDELQTLEVLADEAARTGDPSKLRSVLKRSISMNQHTVIDQMDDIGQDNVDKPIIKTQPSQVLKRSVRTKIRKPSLQGDGGGHRFAAQRKGKVFQAAPDRFIPGQEPDPHSSSTSEPEPFDSKLSPRPTSPGPTGRTSEEYEPPWNNRPSSYSEESAIYDSYIDSGAGNEGDDVDSSYTFANAYESTPESDVIPISEASEPTTLKAQHPHQYQQHQPLENVSPQFATQLPLQQPTPLPYYQNIGTSSPGQQILPPRSPSPSNISEAHSEQSMTPSVTSSKLKKEKEKDKKGGLFAKAKWGGEKDSKAKRGKGGASDRDSVKEKEKESGFFGSLFGGGKKKQEDTGLGQGSGPATAAALLGQSRSAKQQQPTVQHPLASPNTDPNYGMPGFGYARYPIHVERAVYRLSHIKLANPRRPLHEQVLISNLMFWYLGIINKPTTPPAAVIQPTPSPTSTSPLDGTEQQIAPPEAQPQVSQSASISAPPSTPQSEYVPQLQAVPEHGGRDPESTVRQPSTRGNSKPVYAATEHESHPQAQTNGPVNRREREREAPSGGRRNKTQGSGSGDLNSNSRVPQGEMSARRKAETPVKGPQYGMSMVIEQEELDRQRDQQQHGRGQSQSQTGRPPLVHSPVSGYSSEPGNGNVLGPRPRNKSSAASPPPQSSQQYYESNGVLPGNVNHYDPKKPDALDSSPRNAAVSPPPITRHPPSRSSSSSLPPGAMPPMQQSQHGIRAISRTHSNVNGNDDDNFVDQYYQPSSQPPQSTPPYRSQSVPPHETPQVRSTPPQQSVTRRSPSSGSEKAGGGGGSGGRPKTSPSSESSGKFPGRSLSASAVASDTHLGGRRSRSPPRTGPANSSSSGEANPVAPRARSRSRTREEGLPDTSTPPPPPALPSSLLISSKSGARSNDRHQRAEEPMSLEEDDLPLSVYQQRQREQLQYQQQQSPQFHAQSGPGQLYQYQYQQSQQYPQSQSQDWNYARH